MVTPYELAYLCEDAYRDDSMVQPASYEINIPGAGNWGVGAHDGVSNSFFCTKYIKCGSGENVIAFRGTSVNRVADLAVDGAHLFSRNSGYINAALAFMRRFRDRDTIVTGHSLGGFIAVTMAFHFPLKVAAFNPPWTGVTTPWTIGMAVASAIMDNYNAANSPNFRASKLIIYQSNTDLATSITHPSRIRASNVNFIRIGAIGVHNLGPIIENFRRSRNYAISW